MMRFSRNSTGYARRASYTQSLADTEKISMAPAPQPTHSARRGAGPAPPRARATPAPRPRGRRCPDCHRGRCTCTPAARRPGARRRARRPRRRRSGCLSRSSASKLGIAPSPRSAARAAAAPSPIWLPARLSSSTFRSPPPACAARSASITVRPCASSHPRPT